MANRKKNSVLTSQVISKLLDSPGINVPKNSDVLRLLHGTAEKPPQYSETHAKATVMAARQWARWQGKYGHLSKRATKIDKALIFFAWILLVSNVLAVIGSLGYEPGLPLSLHAIENTNSFLFRMGILAFGAFVLFWTSWLYLRNRAGKTVAVPLLIIIALSVTLAPFVKEQGAVITNIRGLGRTLLCSFPANTQVTTTPMYRLVTGILYSEDEPSAVIGNRIVHEGDAFHGINIVKIYKDKVEFEKNGSRWTQSIESKPSTY